MLPSIRDTFVATFLFTIAISSAGQANEPYWIWGSENANQQADDGECEFRRSFRLSAPAKSIIIELTVDDQYTLRVNDRYITGGTDARQTRRFDVTPVAQVGENTIYVRGRNHGGPAGFLASINIVLASGESQTIVTDKTWQAKIQKSGTWDPSIRQRTPWHEPFVLGEADIEPWANIVKKAERTEKVKPPVNSDGPFELLDGDRVVLLGNTFIERSQRYGYIECELTRLYPNRNSTFKNLGWSGDTVFGEARARFGTTQDGFQHLETQVHLVEPTLILAAYGSNAAFAGRKGLDGFIAGYDKLLNVLEATGARITLVSPMKQIDLGPPLPNPTEYNKNLAEYRDAIGQLAKRRSLGFVDLFDVLNGGDAREVTDNGLHLTAGGYRFAATEFAHRLKISPSAPRVTIDAATSQVEATGATVSEISSVDGSIAFHTRLNTLPLASSQAFPAEAFFLKVPKLPDGNYSLTCNGKVLTVANAAKLESGVPILRGPDVAQAELLRQAICKKNELFFHRWRPQNETYLFLFRKHEQGNNAVEIPRFDPLVAEQEALIAKLRQPKTHIYSLQRK